MFYLYFIEKENLFRCSDRFHHWIPHAVYKTEPIYGKWISETFRRTVSETFSLLVAFEMAASIKLFSFIRKYRHVLGLYSLDTSQNVSSFNSRNWIYIISYVLFFVPSVAFFLYDAKSMQEYGISFYSASMAFFLMCIYTQMVVQMKNICHFTESFEQLIEKSE